MATSKPISSISYNTEDFLVSKLDDLIQSGVISFWVYIKHNGESRIDDEANGKDHLHLLMIPNKCVDLVEVGKVFKQFYANDPAHPLRCMPFRTSKTEDWLLYALHDPDYIMLHGLDKTYVYDVVDFKSSDPDFLHQLWIEAKQSFANNPSVKIRKKANAGVSFASLVRSGSISIQQIRNAELYYSYLWDGKNETGNGGVLSFDNGLLVLPNGDLKWEQEIFGSGDI